MKRITARQNNRRRCCQTKRAEKNARNKFGNGIDDIHRQKKCKEKRGCETAHRSNNGSHACFAFHGGNAFCLAGTLPGTAQPTCMQIKRRRNRPAHGLHGQRQKTHANNSALASVSKSIVALPGKRVSGILFSSAPSPPLLHFLTAVPSHFGCSWPLWGSIKHVCFWKRFRIV